MSDPRTLPKHGSEKVRCTTHFKACDCREAYVAELEKDRARLEWLAQFNCQIARESDGWIVLWLAQGDQGYEETDTHADWRDTIDEAMAQQGESDES